MGVTEVTSVPISVGREAVFKPTLLHWVSLHAQKGCFMRKRERKRKREGERETLQLLKYLKSGSKWIPFLFLFLCCWSPEWWACGETTLHMRTQSTSRGDVDEARPWQASRTNGGPCLQIQFDSAGAPDACSALATGSGVGWVGAHKGMSCIQYDVLAYFKHIWNGFCWSSMRKALAAGWQKSKRWSGLWQIMVQSFL